MAEDIYGAYSRIRPYLAEPKTACALPPDLHRLIDAVKKFLTAWDLEPESPEALFEAVSLLRNEVQQ